MHLGVLLKIVLRRWNETYEQDGELIMSNTEMKVTSYIQDN